MCTLMKILCLFDTGVDRGECHLLIGLKRMGVEPYVICKPDTARIDTLREAGIEVETWTIRSKIDPALIRRLRSLIRQYKFDLVHAFRKGALSNYTLASIGLGGRPVVAYRGIIGNLSYWDPFSWMTFLNPRISRIICVCDAIQNYFLKKRFMLFFNLFDKKKVVRIYKGHRLEWYEKNADTPRILPKIGIPSDSLIIGCISRIQARKGIRELILAMEHVKSDKSVHLVILGMINDKSYQDALLQSTCKNRIHVMGYYPDAALIAHEFDIITLPSLRREGLPRSVIEGMAQGIPPVVTNAGGSPELIEQGVSGLVVPPGDPIALAEAFNLLLADEDLRINMGNAARMRIDRCFNVDTSVQETFDLYRNVLNL